MKNLLLYSLFVLLIALAAAGCAVEDNLPISHPTETTSPTNTLAPSETAALPPSTPTQHISEIPSLQITNTNEAGSFDNPFGKQLAVAVEFPDQAIVVFDFETGESRRLREDGSFVFVDWADKGCGLIIGDTISDVGSVYKIDLQGNFIEEITSYDIGHVEGYIGLGVSDIYLSPSEEYAAYIVSAYEDRFRRDPSLFNLYVSRVGDPDSMNPISHNDGVLDVAWSPDGSLIAFLDYDDSGVLQLYVSDPENTQKYQLTSYSSAHATIQHIAWSPNQEYIAFYYVVPKEGEGLLQKSMVIVPVHGLEQPSKIISSIEGKEFYEVQNVWWEGDNVIVLDIFDSSSGKNTSGVYWINIQTDSVVNKVLPADVGSSRWSQSLISEGRLGFRVYPEFWIFDLETREVIAKTDMPVDLESSWNLAPLDFPGEAFCDWRLN